MCNLLKLMVVDSGSGIYSRFFVSLETLKCLKKLEQNFYT